HQCKNEVANVGMLLLYLGHGDPIQFFFLQSHQLTSVTESYISAKHLVQELTISQRISHIMPSTNFPAGSVEEAVQEAQDLDLTFEKAQAELAKWEAIRDQPAAAQAAIDAGKEEKKKKKKKKKELFILVP
ncbi:unnamed protein product, partial [Fusarium graminearum]